MKNIIFEVKEGIAQIIINRPNAMNALNKETLDEMWEIFSEIENRKDIKIVIVSGSGKKAFVAGADIKELKVLNAQEGREIARKAQKVFSKIEDMPQVVIAAVNGYALGGGNELSMACDIRIVSEKAKFGQPEVNLGILPGFGGTQRLTHLVGKAIAKELIFTTNIIDAQEAYRIGLVNKVVAEDQLMESCLEMAKQIMGKGMFGISLAKAAINDGMNMDGEAAYKYEADMFGLCFATDDQKEGMEAFIEKRQPKFKDF